MRLRSLSGPKCQPAAEGRGRPGGRAQPVCEHQFSHGRFTALSLQPRMKGDGGRESHGPRDKCAGRLCGPQKIGLLKKQEACGHSSGLEKNQGGDNPGDGTGITVMPALKETGFDEGKGRINDQLHGPQDAGQGEVYRGMSVEVGHAGVLRGDCTEPFGCGAYW